MKNKSIVTLLLILICGAVLAGCQPDYSSLQISFTKQIIEVAEDEEFVDVTFTVENYFDGDIKFNLDFNEPKLAVVVENSLQNLGEGHFKFSIAPILVGETSLTASIKGTKHSVTIPVHIVRKITGFELKDQTYIKRNETFNLNAEIFDFKPADTTQKGLTFELVEDLQGVEFDGTNIKVLDTFTQDSLKIKVTSTANATLFKEITLNVVRAVKFDESFALEIKSQSKEDPKVFESEWTSFYSYEKDTSPEEITLVQSDKYNIQKLINVKYDNWEGKVLSVSSSGNVSCNGIYLLTKEGNFEFELSAENLGTSTITFRLVDKNYADNYDEITLKVIVKTMPAQIAVNGNTQKQLMALYTNNTSTYDYDLTVYPLSADKNAYDYKVSFYEGQGFDASEEFAESADGNGGYRLLEEPIEGFTGYHEYFDVLYGGVMILSGEILDETSAVKLGSTLSIRANGASTEKVFVVKISCLYEENEICSGYIYFNINAGTTKFYLDDIYEDDTIYLKMPDIGTGEQAFMGLMSDDNGAIGELEITSSTGGGNVNIKQQGNTTTLLITPNYVGEDEYVITTANGKSVKIKIVVIRQLSQDELAFVLKDTENESVASYQQNENGSLSNIVIKGIDSSIKVGYRLKQTDANENSFKYTLTTAQNFVEIEQDSTITTKQFTGSSECKIDVNVTLYSVNEFKLTATESLEYYDFTIECVNYIQELALYINGDQTSAMRNKEFSIYNQRDLAYVNKNLATVYYYLSITQSKDEKFDNISIKNFTFMAEAEVFLINDLGNGLYDIGGIGIFELFDLKDMPDSSKDIKVGAFTYNNQSLRNYETISIMFDITDENTNGSFNDLVTMNVESYIDVESIWLSAPTEVIYLDNTQTYKQKTLSVYTLPANAMCQDIVVWVDTDDTDCITAVTDGTIITLSYVSAGRGTIRIFPVSKMKTNSYYDQHGNMYSHISIPFVSADGKTEQTALKISDFKVLENLVLNQHYYVDTTINCQGNVLNLGAFEGTIRGTFEPEVIIVDGQQVPNPAFKDSKQLGAITNFKVGESTDGNMAMFKTLLSDAKIYNLTFEGEFEAEFNISGDARLALLCAVNYGTIKNVLVRANKANYININNATNAQVSLHLGYVCGDNFGDIIVDENKKIQTMFVQIEQNNRQTINLGKNFTASVGGIVGQNMGTINFAPNLAVTVNKYGLAGEVYINSNASYLSSVAGANQGLVTGLKMVGELCELMPQNDVGIVQTNNYVAGLVAENRGQVTNNTTRVYVRGYGYVSALVGNNNGTTSGNLVQATDDGSRVGKNASLVIGFNAKSITAIEQGDTLNTALSYITRTKVGEVGDLISNSLNISQYYGDILMLTDAGTNLVSAHMLEKGQEDNIASANIINSLALLAFKQAKDSAQQVLLDEFNLIGTNELLEICNITAKEINFDVRTLNTADIANHGQNIKLLSAGDVKIEISSLLNYTNKTTINLFVSNHYDSIKYFANKDKTLEISNIELINKTTKIIYVDFYANDVNYQNTQIKLLGNKELTFNASEVLNGTDNFVAVVQGQVLYLTAISTQGFNNAQLKLSPYLLIENVKYYVYQDGESQNFKKLAKLEDIDENMIVLDKKSVNGQIGIENISANKYNISLEPSNHITFEVNYNNYNDSDNLKVMLKFNNYLLEFVEGKAKVGNDVLFNMTAGEIKTLNENLYSQSFVISMELGDAVVYEKYLKQIEFLTIIIQSTKIYSATQEQFVIDVTYLPENITSVLINNYSDQDNDQMIKKYATSITVDKNLQLTTNKQFTTGEYNVMNAYINTRYSTFDYVDIRIDYDNISTYMGLLEYSKDGIGRISSECAYVTTSDGLVLRVYRDVIEKFNLNTNYSNMLELSLVYSVTELVPDRTLIPVIFKFYKDDAVVYQQQTTVVAKSENQVAFNVVGKTASTNDEGNAKYSLVRGKKYLLDVNMVGYTPEESVFEISDPSLIAIENLGNGYTLYISNDYIGYDDQTAKTVMVKSYGQKIIDGMAVKGAVKTTQIDIYEYLFEKVDDSNISLKVNNATDIRELVANKLQFEFDKKTQFKVNSFVENFKTNQNVKYYLIRQDGSDFEEIELIDGVKFTQDGDLVDGFNFTAISPKLANYQIGVRFYLSYDLGEPIITDEQEDSNYIQAVLGVDSYLATSADKPKPIYTLEELKAVNTGEHYRLMQDINIYASDFAPIEAEPASFDGNGYNINLYGGAISISDRDSFALFNSIAQNAIFKNITIKILNTLTFIYSYASGANLALLATVNEGTITNCKIKSNSFVNVNIYETIQVMESSLFGAICTQNTGYITHSGVECDISVNGASFGAICAENSGHIASSYVKNSSLYNVTSSTNENIVSGGFVCSNTGKITTSYIEGAQSESRNIYCDGTIKVIRTATKSAGFAYINSGDISDCYSNIPIISSNMCSGFIGINTGGTITRAYSLCKLKPNDTLNFGFVIDYDIESKFDRCFFALEDKIINYYTSTTNYKEKANAMANEYKFESVIEGIEPIALKEFNIYNYDSAQGVSLNKDSKFASFAIDEDMQINGVWFSVLDERQENTYEKTSYFASAPGITGENGENLSLIARRLHLVAPNIYACSNYDIVYEDAENALTSDFEYVITSSKYAEGSKNNPILISSASEFESALNQKRNTFEYFRLIKDIDYYEDEIYISQLFDNTFYGYFEGNDMTISNYSINTILSNNSAGLLAQIGKANSLFTTFKNVSLKPDYINLPNSVYVGGLAGSAVNANVFNVSIESETEKVVGNNIVGGLIGRTYGQTNFVNLYSNISALASKINADIVSNRENIDYLNSLCFNEIYENKAQVSYAGGVIGYLGGQANAQFISVGESTSTLAMSAGLLFGGIGALSSVSYLDLTLNSYNNHIVGYAMAGIVSGELAGSLRNVKINSGIVQKDLFICSPIMPMTVGGLAGYAHGATLENFESAQGYSVIATDFTPAGNLYSPYIATFTGGLFGVANSIKVTNVLIGGGDTLGLIMTGGNYTGGLVGKFLGENGQDTIIKDDGTTEEKTIYANTLKNVQITLLGQKDFVNSDGEGETYSRPFAYLRFVTSSNISGYQPIQDMYVGLVGGADTDNIELDNCNIDIGSGQLMIRYEQYGEPAVTFINFNLWGYRDEFDGDGDVDKAKVLISALNMNTNETTSRTIKKLLDEQNPTTE